jgi:hypothetical protein
MSFIDLSEVDYEARGLLATKPSGDYERWALEIFRRRYAKAKVEAEVAEIAFREACKGGTFTDAEAAAHKKAFNEADSRRSITRAWISQLVRDAADELKFAKKQDRWAAADPECRQYYTAAEEKRDMALKEATEKMRSDLDDVNQDENFFSRGGGKGQKRAIVQAFNERKAEIEEEYYTDRV